MLWFQSEKPVVYWGKSSGAFSHWTESTVNTEASPIAKSSIKTEAAHPSILLQHAPSGCGIAQELRTVGAGTALCSGVRSRGLANVG